MRARESLKLSSVGLHDHILVGFVVTHRRADHRITAVRLLTHLLQLALLPGVELLQHQIEIVATPIVDEERSQMRFRLGANQFGNGGEVLAKATNPLDRQQMFLVVPARIDARAGLARPQRGQVGRRQQRSVAAAVRQRFDVRAVGGGDAAVTQRAERLFVGLDLFNGFVDMTR